MNLKLKLKWGPKTHLQSPIIAIGAAKENETKIFGIITLKPKCNQMLLAMLAAALFVGWRTTLIKDWNVSTPIGWIAVTFATHIHVPPRMNWINFGDR